MLEGFYFDPWHGGCLRRIEKREKNIYTIHGVYGNDTGVSIPKNVEYNTEGSETANQYWYATLQVCAINKDAYDLKVCFDGKPGKKRIYYDAVYDARHRLIRWDDSNVWKQMYHHKKQLV